MSLADLNDAPMYPVRLGIAGFNGGGTQWCPLSAAVDKRSNAEPHRVHGSALQAPTAPIAPFSRHALASSAMQVQEAR